jgi:hypothetical protein
MVIFLSCAMHKAAPNTGQGLFVLFPEVRRADADIGVVDFMKYMLNFGFFKFGIEVIEFYVNR